MVDFTKIKAKLFTKKHHNLKIERITNCDNSSLKGIKITNKNGKEMSVLFREESHSSDCDLGYSYTDYYIDIVDSKGNTLNRSSSNIDYKFDIPKDNPYKPLYDIAEREHKKFKQQYKQKILKGNEPVAKSVKNFLQGR